MQYILTAGWDDGIADLTRRLAEELLAGKRMVWLVSGGSNIPASVQVMDNLSPDLTRNLTIMPADERYGAVGHPDSNWQQLLDAGFNSQSARTIEVLQPDLDFQATADRYQQLAEQVLTDCDIIIAQLGIGEDGHIAGIMIGADEPENSTSLTIQLSTQPFRRLSLSFAGLRLIDAAYAFAFGAPKLPALTALRDQTLPLTEQPAQILKELNEAYVYNDQLGETT